MLLCGTGVAALDRFRKIREVGAGLRNQFWTGCTAVTGIDGGDAIADEIVEFIETLQPTVEMALLQVEMGVVVDEIGRKQSLRVGKIESRDVFSLALAEFDNF